MPTSLRASSFILLALFTSLGVACGDSSATGGSDVGGGAQGGGAEGGAGGSGGIGTTGPINSPEGEWTWVDFPDTQCMNGSATGIAINRSSASDNVVIFMEGGNACFNLASCIVTANPDGYSEDTFEADGRDAIASYPYLDPTNPDNPFKDYSLVYIPYCTGDLHFGQRADVDVGNEIRQFHGFGNVTSYLDRLVPTFPNATKVVLTGISAGGFGAALNYDHVAQAFGTDIETELIDDSGPPMSGDFIAPCLQDRLAETWGLDDTLPADCDGCTGSPFVEPYVDFLLQKYPDRSLGLISSDGDETISTLLGFGENDCASIDSAPDAYDPAKYRAGLEDLRDCIGATGGTFRLYLIESTEHVWLDNPIGSVEVDGVQLQDWVQQGIDEDPAWDNVAAP